MMPHRIHKPGSMKYAERAARHNHSLVGVSCCGELKLCVEPSIYRAVLGDFIVAVRCTGCGAILDVRRILPDLEASLYNDDDEAEDEPKPWLG